MARESVNVPWLEYRITSPKDTFLAEGTPIPDKTGILVHRDIGAKVLAVAHLDWVGTEEPWFGYNHYKDGSKQVFSDRLDDRLGAYAILDFLPRLGVDCDILLTDNEEKGATTAAEFQTTKDYNWIFQFDRNGTDVVMYQYETAEYKKLLQDNGFTVGVGSFTCIRKLEHIGVAGFNLGTGYYRQHSKDSYANLHEFEDMCHKFAAFYDKMKDVKLPHDAKKASEHAAKRWSGYGAYSAGHWKHEDEFCEWCKKEVPWRDITYAGGWLLCAVCLKRHNESFGTAGTRSRAKGVTYQMCMSCKTWEPDHTMAWQKGKRLCKKCQEPIAVTATVATDKSLDAMTPSDIQRWNEEHLDSDKDYDEMLVGDCAAADAAYERMKAANMRT